MITSEHWNNDSLGNGAQLNENTCRKLQHVNSKTFSPSVVGVVIEAPPRSSLKEPYLQPRSSGAEVGSVESLLIKIVKQGGSKKIVCLTRISCSFFEAGQKKGLCSISIPISISISIFISRKTAHPQLLQLLQILDATGLCLCQMVLTEIALQQQS